MILNYYQYELPLNSLSKSENKALRENKDQKVCSEIQYFFVNRFEKLEIVNEIALLDKKRGEKIKNLKEKIKNNAKRLANIILKIKNCSNKKVTCSDFIEQITTTASSADTCIRDKPNRTL